MDGRLELFSIFDFRLLDGFLPLLFSLDAFIWRAERERCDKRCSRARLGW